MRSRFLKAFTLVEMLVALAVSSIIITATYSSYDMIATQYKKNMDIIDMHTSGRAIMRIIKRDIRMAGFEYRDNNAIITYGSISSPLTIKDSGNKCCDEVTVIYDYYDEESKKAERIRIRYWAEPHTSNKGSRHRLYKQKDILGQNNAILASPIIGTKTVMADYIEDLQVGSEGKNTGSRTRIASNIRFPGSYRLSTPVNARRIIYETISGPRAGSKWSELAIFWVGTTDAQGQPKLYVPQIATSDCETKWSNGPTYTGSAKFSIDGNSGTKWTCNKGFPAIIKFDLNSPDYLIKSIDARWDGSVTGSNNVNIYIENNAVSNQSLFEINLILRSKNQYSKDRTFKKKDYHSGNFKLDKTDKYKRDTFSSTVLVRNLAL